MSTKHPQPGTCLVEIYPADRWDWGQRATRYCGRPVKGTGPESGQQLCGIHLRVETQRLEKSTGYDRRVERIKAVQARLGIGISGYAFDQGFSDGGPVKVHLASLEALAARLEAAEARRAADDAAMTTATPNPTSERN